MAGEGWYGGGADLTPYYLDDRDVEEFHRFYKGICDRYDDEVPMNFLAVWCTSLIYGGDCAAVVYCAIVACVVAFILRWPRWWLCSKQTSIVLRY